MSGIRQAGPDGLLSLPPVSVVVATWNGEDRLGRCIDAIRGQDYPGEVELIVVDDASFDYSATVAERSGAVVIRSEVNGGPGHARNLGVARATHGIVAFTDDDCVPEPDWLSELIPHLSPERPAACGLTVPDGNHSLLLRYLAVNNPMLPLEHRVEGRRPAWQRLWDYACTLASTTPDIRMTDPTPRPVFSTGAGNLAIVKETFIGLDGFDPEYRFSGEDQDLSRRFAQRYPGGLTFVPQAIVRHTYRDSLYDTLRRSAAYAEGHMALRERNPEVGILLFPVPVAWGAATTVLVLRDRRAALLPTVLLPFAYLRYLGGPGTSSLREQFAYGYLNFLQDVSGNWGVLRYAVLRELKRRGRSGTR